MSVGTTILIAQVYEGGMLSCLFSYEDGIKSWDVMHDSSKGLTNLDIEGTPPKIIDEVRGEMTLAQHMDEGQDADVDYFFDIPIVLGKRLCGFQHNTYDMKEESPRWIEMRSAT